MKLGLGDRARDAITGFEGIVTARHEYVTGCVRFTVESESLEDTKLRSEWFDEVRLRVVMASAITFHAERPSELAPAGPQDDPPSLREPPRG